MIWKSVTRYFGFFALGWNIFTHCMELFFLNTIIKLLQSSIFLVLSLTYSIVYSWIGLLELVDGFCDVLCPPCYYFLHRCTTVVIGLLPDPSIPLYGRCPRGRRSSSGKNQWRLGSRRRRNFWQNDHCNRGSQRWYYRSFTDPSFIPHQWCIDDTISVNLLGHTSAYLWQLITRLVTSWSLLFRRVRSLCYLLHSRFFPPVIPLTTDSQHNKWYNSPLWRESAGLFGHLPTSSDFEGVLSTFPPESSTTRSGTPLNNKKSGVKGTNSGVKVKSGVKGVAHATNRKKSGVKGTVRLNPTNRKKSGVKEPSAKPGTKPEKQPKYSRSGYHKNSYYIDSGASHHVVFNGDHLDNIQELDDPLQLACGGNDMNMTQLGSLSKALCHLPLPKQGYYYDQNSL